MDGTAQRDPAASLYAGSPDMDGMSGDPAFAVLRCPHCGGPYAQQEKTLRCPAGHAVDVARQGYVNLLTAPKQAGTADTAAMVAARAAFLDAGHYAPLSARLAELAAGQDPKLVLDAGAGTGHHLAAVLKQLPDAYGIAMDSSVPALKKAARNPRTRGLVWSVWEDPWPVGDGTVDLLLDVFAPRNGPEFHRVLAPGGTLLVVTPTARHLAELREAADGMLTVDVRKEERLEAALAGFDVRSRETLTLELDLDAEAAGDAVRMGPSAHHRAAAPSGPVRTTAEFSITVCVKGPITGK